mmetsp:Transcript_16337/g.46468  ORF Transcript_16337/g.46468 Transcript_16337/m.46468 type:complete len:311 (-) Transcript_16337:306-1238(-)
MEGRCYLYTHIGPSLCTRTKHHAPCTYTHTYKSHPIRSVDAVGCRHHMHQSTMSAATRAQKTQATACLHRATPRHALSVMAAPIHPSIHLHTPGDMETWSHEGGLHAHAHAALTKHQHDRGASERVGERLHSLSHQPTTNHQQPQPHTTPDLRVCPHQRPSVKQKEKNPPHLLLSIHPSIHGLIPRQQSKETPAPQPPLPSSIASSNRGHPRRLVLHKPFLIRPRRRRSRIGEPHSLHTTHTITIVTSRPPRAVRDASRCGAVPSLSTIIRRTPPLGRGDVGHVLIALIRREEVVVPDPPARCRAVAGVV